MQSSSIYHAQRQYIVIFLYETLSVKTAFKSVLPSHSPTKVNSVEMHVFTFMNHKQFQQ